MDTFDPVDLSLNAAVSEDGTKILCTWNYHDVPLNFITTPAVVVDLNSSTSSRSYNVIPSTSTSFVLTDISYGATHDVYVTYYNTNTHRAYMSEKVQVTHGYAPTALTSSTVEIIPGNSRISLRLKNYVQHSPDDGYSNLSRILVKVIPSIGNPTYVYFTAASYNLYTDFLPINNLVNDITYDLDILVSNFFGNGKPYGASGITPTNNIVGVRNLIAVENIALNPSVAGIAVLFNAPLYDSALVTKYTIVTCDSSGVQIGSPADFITDASGNPTNLTDFSGNVIRRTLYNGSQYSYKYLDTPVANSTIRQYKVYVTNPNGISVINTTALVTGCSLPGAPTIVVIPVVSQSPGQGSIQVNITNNSLNGLPLANNLVKVWRTSDASQNAVGGYNYIVVTGMDGSGNVTLTHANIFNGINYTVGVKTVTQGTSPNTYMSVAASGSAVPYARPATPVAPTVSPVDASGNPLGGKLDISWVAPASYTASAQYGVDSSLNYALYTADASGAYTVSVYDGQLLSKQVQDLTDGRTYGYVLKTYVMNGDNKVFSGASSPIRVAVPFAAPRQVATFTPTANGLNSISYRFTGLSVSDASHNIRYQLDVYCSDSSSAVFTNDNVIADVSNSITYAQINNKLGFTHTLKIKAYVVDSQVSPNTKYYGQSRDQTVIPYIVPGEPQSLDVVPSNVSFSCTWLNVPGLDVSSNVGGVHITGYSVQLLSGAGSNLDSQTTSSNLFYSQTGLTNGTVYGVKVTPVGCIGNNISDGTIIFFDNYAVNYSFMPANNVPATPVFLKYSPNDGAVELKWLEPKSFLLGTWNIYQDNVFLPQLSLSPQWRVALQSDTTGSYGSYNLWYLTISGLTNGQRYKFTVMAENNSGLGSSTAEIYTVPQKPPGSPTNASYAVTQDSLTLTWNAPATDGGASKLGGLKYRVNLYDTTDMSGGSPLPIQNTGKTLIAADLVSGINPFETPNSSTLSTITKTFTTNEYHGIISGHTYAAEIYAFYTVSVDFVDINGSIQYDSFTSISVLPLIRRAMLVTQPAPDVESVTAVGGNNSVTLSWTDPSQNVYTLGDHKIYSKIDNGVASYTLLTTVPQSAGVNRAFTYTDNTVLNGNSYLYKVVLTNTSTSPPAGTLSNSVTPFGKPIFATGNVVTTDNANFTVSICKNGSVLTDYIAVGLVSDSSGDIIPVSMGTPNFFPNVSTSFNGATIAAGQAGTFSFTMTNDNNGGLNIVNVNDMLLIVGNAKGTTSVIWPSNSTAFTSGGLRTTEHFQTTNPLNIPPWAQGPN